MVGLIAAAVVLCPTLVPFGKEVADIKSLGRFPQDAIVVPD